MKKFLLGLLLLAGLSLPMQAGAADAGNPVEKLTGKVWMDSQPANKRAFLFGIDTVIAIDKTLADLRQQQAAKTGKKPVYVLSLFDKSWMKAFENTTRDQLIEQINQWYEANPQKLDRPVMDVIWYEIIEPRLKAAK